MLDVAGLVLLVAVLAGLFAVLLASATLGTDSVVARRRAADRREANARAESLLRAVIGENEYEDLNRRGYLEIASPSDPWRVYRIPRRRGQVRVYDSGRPTWLLCVQSVEPIPDADAVVMHKLMIEGNEAEYLRVANRVDLARWRLSPE